MRAKCVPSVLLGKRPELNATFTRIKRSMLTFLIAFVTIFVYVEVVRGSGLLALLRFLCSEGVCLGLLLVLLL